MGDHRQMRSSTRSNPSPLGKGWPSTCGSLKASPSQPVSLSQLVLSFSPMSSHVMGFTQFSAEMPSPTTVDCVWLLC